MSPEQERLQEETRIAERPLYRAGQTQPAPKATPKVKAPSIAKPSMPKAKATVPGKSGPLSKAASGPPSKTKRALLFLLLFVLLGGVGYYAIFSANPATRRRVRVGLLTALALLAMGGISYCIFLPDPVEEAKRDLAALWNDETLSREEQFKKSREIVSGLSEKQKFDMGKERRS